MSDDTPIRYLSPEGEAVQTLPEWAQKPDQLIAYYEAMVLCRAADLKAVALQRTGQLGTYPSALGQEAIATVFGGLMEPEDVLVPYYRDHCAKYQRGCGWEHIYRYWGGDERGSAAGALFDFPDCVPIATQCGHAIGVAAAFKARGQKQVAVCSLGDGATSKGDFYEAINTAGVWKLPAVFIINNNQWAISVPRRLQTAAPTLAQKGTAVGVKGVRVDGNDVIALHEVVNEAYQRARQQSRGCVIEAITYRLGDHTTADDASRYRPHDEVQTAWEEEPVKRLQRFLANQGWWDEAKEVALQERVKAHVDEAVKTYLNFPEPDLAEAFDYHYEVTPAGLEEQKQEAYHWKDTP